MSRDVGDGEGGIQPRKPPRDPRGSLPGCKGAGAQQVGKLISDSLPTKAEVISVQTNNSINNVAVLTSQVKPISSGALRGGRKQR